MPRLKLTIEYDGTGFRGFARQPGERTVEGELRRATGELYERFDDLAVAGRTDTGVHALANVDLDRRRAAARRQSRAAEALNAVLPDDVAVRSAEAVAGRLPRPLRRRVEVLSLSRLAAARALGLRGEAVALVAAAGRSGGAGDERAAP